MTARRCLRRAAPKGNRKKGKCIKRARPKHAKKSETPKALKGIPRKERKRVLKGTCVRWSRPTKTNGKRRCLERKNG